MTWLIKLSPLGHAFRCGCCPLSIPLKTAFVTHLTWNGSIWRRPIVKGTEVAVGATGGGSQPSTEVFRRCKGTEQMHFVSLCWKACLLLSPSNRSHGRCTPVSQIWSHCCCPQHNQKPTANTSTSTSVCKKVTLNFFLINQLQIFHGTAEWNPRVSHILSTTSSTKLCFPDSSFLW